jgi:hypothetical protein
LLQDELGEGRRSLLHLLRFEAQELGFILRRFELHPEIFLLVGSATDVSPDGNVFRKPALLIGVDGFLDLVFRLLQVAVGHVPGNAPLPNAHLNEQWPTNSGEHLLFDKLDPKAEIIVPGSFVLHSFEGWGGQIVELF